jgi:predicted nucleotidyltransferase
VNTYKLKFTKLQSEIFRFLCIKTRQSFSLRKIAKELDVSPTAISKSIKLLEKEKLVIKEKKTDMNQFSVTLNKQNRNIFNLKRIENLKLLYESNLIKELQEKFMGSTIVLFGSYSKGEDTIDSDIDIAIIESKEKKINLIQYEKYLERQINLQFYSSFSKIHRKLRANILNGIILSGSLKL